MGSGDRAGEVVRHSRAFFGLYIEFEIRLKKKKEKEKQGGRKEASKKGKMRWVKGETEGGKGGRNGEREGKREGGKKKA